MLEAGASIFTTSRDAPPETSQSRNPVQILSERKLRVAASQKKRRQSMQETKQNLQETMKSNKEEREREKKLQAGHTAERQAELALMGKLFDQEQCNLDLEDEEEVNMENLELQLLGQPIAGPQPVVGRRVFGRSKAPTLHAVVESSEGESLDEPKPRAKERKSIANVSTPQSGKKGVRFALSRLSPTNAFKNKTGGSSQKSCSSRNNSVRAGGGRDGPISDMGSTKIEELRVILRNEDVKSTHVKTFFQPLIKNERVDAGSLAKMIRMIDEAEPVKRMVVINNMHALLLLERFGVPRNEMGTFHDQYHEAITKAMAAFQ